MSHIGLHASATLGPTPHCDCDSLVLLLWAQIMIVLCHLSVAETHHSSLHWSPAGLPVLQYRFFTCVSDWWGCSVSFWNGSRHQPGGSLCVRAGGGVCHCILPGPHAYASCGACGCWQCCTATYSLWVTRAGTVYKGVVRKASLCTKGRCSAALYCACLTGARLRAS